MDSVPAALGGAVDPSGPRALRSPPLLVGRTLERILLREELAAVLGGRGRLVLLGGDAGIGKTTLARDLASEATARNVRVLVGGCYDLTNTPPYGPWLDLFEEAATESGLPSPPAAFAGGRLAPVTDQAGLFAEVHTFFTGLGAAGPAVLLLEDLHWADPASLELLRYLAPRLRHWPILLLVSYRGDELTRRHPFAVQLPALVRAADGLRLDLRRLETGALGELVEARYDLSGTDKARLVTYLDRHGEGNPLFTTELLRALEEEGLLCPTDSGWMLGQLDRVLVPLLLRQVIEGRVARLGEVTRQRLAIAAVIGQEVPLALWAKVAELDEEALLAIVERAVDAHLLEADSDGRRIRFVHSLTREALYASVLPARRRLWHCQVGENLAEGLHPDADAVAYHFQAAGDPRASAWLIAAGGRAQRAYAWLTAAQRLRAAAALLGDGADQEQTRGDLLCRVAFLTRFSDPTGAIEAIDSAAAVAERLGNLVMAAKTTYVRGLLLCYLDRFRSGLDDMVAGVAALEALSSEPSRAPAVFQNWLADALPGAGTAHGAEDERTWEYPYPNGSAGWRGVALGRFLATAGYLRTTIDDCSQLDTALPDLPEPQARTRVFLAFNAHALGIAQAGLGRPDDARAAFARARANFAELDHHALVAYTLLDELMDVTLRYDAANPAARRRISAEAEVALDRTGGALRPGVSPRLAWLGCLILDGRWREADQILGDLAAPGNANLRRGVTAAHALLSLQRGTPERAWQEIRELLLDGPETEPGGQIHQEGLFLQRLAARLCLDAGDLPVARAWLAAHDRWLAWSESVLGQADGQVSWGRYYQGAGDIDRARATVSAALDLASNPDQPLTRLEALRLLGEIETMSGNYAVAEAHFAAALDLAIRCEVPFERALTLLELARLHLASGLTNEVTPLLEEVKSICGPLGATPTLARVEELMQQLQLERPLLRYPAGQTAREIEILRLLPRGLSTPQIAVALFISPRTVQTHLTNLYAKLGVGGRAEAIAYAISHGLV